MLIGVDGSSPRVRGKHGRRRPVVAADGLIPARAGKTEGCCSSWSPWSAHPHACGENQEFSILQVARLGSSPRVRGKPLGEHAAPGWDGLIPARAGKTPRRTRRPRMGRAHPRACGENARLVESVRNASGSSPRVRGKLSDRARGSLSGGLIPARAGKTMRLVMRRVSSAAHPRACGENHERDHILDADHGSSPRVRGKPSQRPRTSAPGRLIPARAGKTSRHQRADHHRGAHPRACGENVIAAGYRSAVEGSSPRVRGKRL